LRRGGNVCSHKATEALDAWIDEHPESDADTLRGLIDTARNAPSARARKTASRALFRYLSERAQIHAS
jgi:ribosome-associated protein